MFIDLDTWPRRDAYAFFEGFADPWFNLTTNVAAGPTWAWCKANGQPFSLAVWFAVQQVALEVPALRMRLRDEGVWLHDRIRIGSTVLRDDGSFVYVALPNAGEFSQYVVNARERMALRKREGGLLEAEDALDHPTDDRIYGTTVPWVAFTSIQHARSGDPMDSVPRVAVGRIVDGQLPVSLAAHHALVDGLHAGQFFEGLARRLADPEATFGGGGAPIG